MNKDTYWITLKALLDLGGSLVSDKYTSVKHFTIIYHSKVV